MDEAFRQHSPHTRRHNHSATNLSHLTLAPLTSRLPISDSDDLPAPELHHVSYIEGRSAPTTPSILSRSSSKVALKRPAHITLPKSKSSTHLSAPPKSPRYVPTTPGGTKLRQTITREDLTISALSSNDRKDSDWLLRAGASITTSARESKGQEWLVSRASSTSLTGQHLDDEDEPDHALLREREYASRRSSRRGSLATADADDEFSPITVRQNLSFGHSMGPRSNPHSRHGSRHQSRRASRAQLYTPMAGDSEGYFDQKDIDRTEFVTEPDFVDNLDEALEQEREIKDEEEVRRLAKANSNGLGGWIERMLGWSLFSVEDDGDDREDEREKRDFSDAAEEAPRRGGDIERYRDLNIANMPPPQEVDADGWKDAAWLLSVASKVLL